MEHFISIWPVSSWEKSDKDSVKKVVSFDHFELGIVIVALGILGAGSYFLLGSEGQNNSSRGAVVAELVDLWGVVQVQRAGQFSWERINPEQSNIEFYAGDTLRTAEKSMVRIKNKEQLQIIKEKSLVIFRAPESSAKAEVSLFETPPAEEPLVTVKPVEVPAPAPVLWTAFKAPEWNKIETDPVEMKLVWRADPGAFSAYTVQVISNEKVIWQSKVRDQHVKVPPSVREQIFSDANWAEGRSGYAVVKGHTGAGDGSGSWSLPYFFRGQASPVKLLEAQLQQAVVELQSETDGRFSCYQKNAAIKVLNAPSADEYEIYYEAGRESWTQKAKWTSGDEVVFCPHGIGQYQVQLKAMRNGKLIAESAKFPLRAHFVAPLWASRILSGNRDTGYRLPVNKPQPWPVEIEFLRGEGSNARSQKVRLKNLAEILTETDLNDDPKVRMRYVNEIGQELSSWSPIQKLEKFSLERNIASEPSPQEKKSTSERYEDLKIESPQDTGVVMTGWSERVWSELHWTHHPAASQYELEVSSEGQFSGEQKGTILRANRFFTAVENTNLLYWRVRVIAANGQMGPWTEVRTVRVQAVDPINPSVPIRSRPHLRRPPGRVLGDAAEFSPKKNQGSTSVKTPSDSVVLP